MTNDDGQRKRPPRIEINPPPAPRPQPDHPPAAGEHAVPERELPENLRADWEVVERHVKAADRSRLDAMCQILDAIDWAVYEASTIEDARLFLAKAVRLADNHAPRATIGSDDLTSLVTDLVAKVAIQRSAANANANHLLDMIVILQRRMTEAVGLIKAGRTDDGCDLLERQVTSLDRLDVRPIEKR